VPAGWMDALVMYSSSDSKLGFVQTEARCCQNRTTSSNATEGMPAMKCINEMKRIQLVLFGTHNRTVGPYLASRTYIRDTFPGGGGQMQNRAARVAEFMELQIDSLGLSQMAKSNGLHAWVRTKWLNSLVEWIDQILGLSQGGQVNQSKVGKSK
jgi:hypothetical protein